MNGTVPIEIGDRTTLKYIADGKCFKTTFNSGSFKKVVVCDVYSFPPCVAFFVISNNKSIRLPVKVFTFLDDLTLCECFKTLVC